MASPDVLVSTILDTSAALLNDTQKQIYTYDVQLPYCKLAFRELREILEESDIPVVQLSEAIFSIPANTSVISFNSIPSLPSDLVEIQMLWERQAGTPPWIPMSRLEYLPHYLEDSQIGQFLVWTWLDNAIHLFPATNINDLKLDYIKQLPDIVDQNSMIRIINGQPYLEYRTAALCSSFIGSNPTRATELNAYVVMAQDKLLNIENKAKQAIVFRRRPFRQSYKQRGII